MSFTSDEIRQTFIDYFARHDHRHVASGSLIPADDPTLLFTNAGMNQFKSVFLGEATCSDPRAVTVQKCMRVSGKHNDLETVGPSLYHHTFFEMMGNFSFGDYFKPEAIRMAWELLTEEYGIAKDRLWVTVYEQDDEAERLWVSETDLLPGRVVRLGKEHNYWSMGETGPCGPCSELHYDYEWDGTPLESPDFDSDRFVELWNLVFMQFNATRDGGLQPLPAPNIDTGAGFERLVAVLSGTRSNYDTDLFQPIIAPVAEAMGCAYGDDADKDVALRVIADHSRALAFLLADGVMPSNEGRGYVLRRLLRRAMRFGMKLGYDRPFLNRSALQVVQRMHPSYPELAQHRDLIERVIGAEEERFLRTLAAGSQMFNELAAELHAAGESTLPGDAAFRLYDTFGLPLELAREFATAEGLEIDEAAFQAAMEAQRQRARAAWKGSAQEPLKEVLRNLAASHGGTGFLAYESTDADDVTVLGLVRDGGSVDALAAGDSGGAVFDRTPYYGESGGQIGDRGRMEWADGSAVIHDATRPVTGVILHSVDIERGRLRVGDRVALRVDAERRQRTRRNHTATHLLHAALREQLGEHVRQAGSLVEPERLRFDFAHYDALGPEDLERLERTINEVIRRDVALEIQEMGYDEALERGALAFFGDKYGDWVRVVSVPGISTELCGGTHVERTGEIGMFVIHKEESVAAGTRRIEAVTGQEAVQALQHYRSLVRVAAAHARTPEEELPESIERLLGRAHRAERQLEELRVRMASQQASADLHSGAVEVAGVLVVRRQVEGLDASGLRKLADELKSRVGSGVVVLGSANGGKATLVVGVTDDVCARVGAGDIVRELAPLVGGGGGGHPAMAQAGGPDASKVSDALEKAPELIAKLLE